MLLFLYCEALREVLQGVVGVGERSLSSKGALLVLNCAIRTSRGRDLHALESGSLCGAHDHLADCLLPWR